jgi:hypothetical protein
LSAWSDFEDFYRSPATREEYIFFIEKSNFLNRYNDYVSTALSTWIRDSFKLSYVDFWDVKFRISVRAFHLMVSSAIGLFFWITAYKLIIIYNKRLS